LTFLSGIGSVPHVVDVRAVRFDPVGVPLAQLALSKRPAPPIGAPGEDGSAGAAAANGATCRILACEQLNLFGQVRQS
jgi:hypothetical protein